MRTVLLRLAQIAAGVLAGLVVAEGAFTLRDDRAFPHVNFYVEDAELGTRLAPHSSQRLAFGGNPTTSIATNSLGYRMPEWPEGDGGILVVGDSQVFGLGVERDQTTPAQLRQLLGETVLNGGVPTYGPDEYLAVVEDVLTRRELDTVVVVFNFSNDLFEVNLPNRERHAVWDGWAVRTETAPESVTEFPGRRWLYSQSHAFFALRKWMHTPTELEALGLPSEGTVDDVLGMTQTAQQAQVQRAKTLQIRQRPQQEAYLAALDQLGNQRDLVKLFRELEIGHETNDDLKLQAVEAQASVGDIVGTSYTESTRRITVTAQMLQEGAQIRRTVRSRLYAQMQADPDGWATASIREALKADLTIEPVLASDSAEVGWVSPLDGPLDRLAALAQAHGFVPVVVALPLDVQVLPSQFAKYGEPPRDMSDSRILLEDLAQAARRRGIRVALPLQALAEAGDPAFLQRDLHLSPIGHAAVAEILAATIEGPAPVPPPPMSIAPGRSRIPWDAEWRSVREIRVTHSSRNLCQTRQVREWFRMDCSNEGKPVVGLRIVQAPLEAHGWYGGGVGTIITPMLPARDVVIDVVWEDRTERLAMRWGPGGWQRGFEATEPAAAQPGTEFTLEAGGSAVWFGSGTTCERDSFSECARGLRTTFPVCTEGFANAGSAGHCFALCSPDTPCTEGECTPWNGSAVCL